MKSQLNKITTLIFFVLIPTNILLAQDTIHIVSQIVESRDQKIARLIIERDLYVKKYIDSLNNYKVNKNCELPSFFVNPNFDKDFGNQFMLSMHRRVSLRKLIIDKLENYELMWCVVKSNDKRLKEKYTGRSKRFYLDYSKIPFEQYSTFELVDMRLDELENNKSLRLKN